MAPVTERYCNPGNGFDKCWAEKWGCTPELIAELRLKYPFTRDHEANYQATVNFINDLKSQGYTQINRYCSLCMS